MYAVFCFLFYVEHKLSVYWKTMYMYKVQMAVSIQTSKYLSLTYEKSW